MKEAFIDKRFSQESEHIIQEANKIIAEYKAEGFTLTLRQLYYQFVSRAIIANKQTEYKRLGSIINDARLAGLIDWSAIEDRTRNLESHNSWSDPAGFLQACARAYTEDWWIGQSERVEVWIEKEALIGIIEPICNEFQIPYFACRGYSSQSEQYAAGQRFRDRFINEAQRTHILHLGDHDPSGIDMTRDNRERLAMFACSRHIVRINRIALNMDQVEEFNPPPNPAKLTDSRAQGYIENYGDESWELDALSPSTIDSLIREQLDHIIDFEMFEACKTKEEINRDKLIAAAQNLE